MEPFRRLPQSSASTESDFKKPNEWKEYCDLELIPTEKSDRSISKIQSVLALIVNLWQKAIAVITKEPELEIWQQDHHGQIHWHVYDPLTRESISFVSEAEMWSWIESRYCR
jgi:hypothetical protein